MIGNIVSSLGWLAFVQSNRNLSLSAFLKIVRYLNYFILQLFLKGLDIFGVFCFCFNDISVYFVHVSVIFGRSRTELSEGNISLCCFGIHLQDTCSLPPNQDIELLFFLQRVLIELSFCFVKTGYRNIVYYKSRGNRKCETSKNIKKI